MFSSIPGETLPLRFLRILAFDITVVQPLLVSWVISSIFNAELKTSVSLRMPFTTSLVPGTVPEHDSIAVRESIGPVDEPDS